MKAILFVLSFYITFPQAKADVGCYLGGTTTGRCAHACRKMFCDGGLMGFIKLDTKLKAIKVRVIGENNQPKTDQTLTNPPENLNYYGDESRVNTDRWISHQLKERGIDLERSDRIIIDKDYGLVFGDDVMLYEDGFGQKEQGSLGSLVSSRQEKSQPPPKQIQCEYTVIPSIVKYKRCPGKILCSGTVRCKQWIGGYVHEMDPVVALCESTGNECPTPTKCMIDDSLDMEFWDTPDNNLFKYKLDDPKYEKFNEDGNQPMEYHSAPQRSGAVQ